MAKRKSGKLSILLVFMFAAFLPLFIGVSEDEASVSPSAFQMAPEPIGPIINIANSIEAIKGYVDYFAGSGSRVTGYAGSYAAAEYIRGEFAEYGLENVDYHYYNVTVPIDRGARLKVLSPANKEVPIYPMWPNRAAIVKTPPGGISGNLVYVGDGTFFDGVPVDGNIVLMDFNSWENWLRLANLGARAVIFIEPYDTTWQQAVLKIIDIELSFPRLYVKRADAKWLLDLIDQGEVAVNLESDMYFETVEAPNVVGYVRGTLFPELYVILSAHYDSFSYVPSVAPGADSAIGISALLELAKFYAKNPPKFSVLFIAYSGTYQGLTGSRTFVAQKVIKNWDDFGKRIVLQIQIDLSADAPNVGISNSGMFYGMHAGLGKNREYFIQYYVPNLIKNIQSTIGTTYKVDSNAFSLELIGVTAGATWYYTVGFLPVFFDTEPLVGIGGTGIAIFTPQVSRNLWGTPIDTPEKVNFANVEVQLKFAYPFIHTILNEERLRSELVPAWTPVFGQIYGPRWVDVIGRIGEYNDVRERYDPVPNALVLYRNAPGVPSLYSIGLWIYTFADGNGRVEVPGIDRAGWTFLAFKVDRETGEILYVPDAGERAYGSVSFAPLMHPYDFGMITVFKAAHIAAFRYWLNFAFFDLAYNRPPLHRGSASIYTGAAGWVGVIHVPYNTTVQLMMYTTPEGEPVGIYRLSRPGEQLSLSHTTLRFSKALYRIDEIRLDELAGVAGSVEAVEVAKRWHEGTRIIMDSAKASLEDYQYSVFEVFESTSWREINAYRLLINYIEDTKRTIPFLGAVLLPFALIAYKFIGATGRKRFLSILLCYLLPSLTLWFLHPGFRIIQNPMIVLLGFSILILGVPVIGIVGNLFLDALKHLRKEVMGLHFVEMPRAAAVALAFSHGIEQMRKRRLRTVMMLFSIIVVTVGVSLFTSASTITEVETRTISLPTPYDGILIRGATWENLVELYYRYTSTRVEPNGTVSTRSWRYHYSPSTPMPILRGEKVANGFAVLGFSPEEAEVSGLDKLLVTGRWFIGSDFRAIILTDAQSRWLGVTSVPDYVNFMGMNLTVIGIIDGQAMNRFKDLDGEPITPLELRIPNVAYDIHIDANEVVIIPYTLARSLGGILKSVAAKLDDPTRLQSMAAELFDILGIMVLAAKGGVQFSPYHRTVITVFGLQYQLIPLAISSLLMMSLALGSVHERKREIGVLGSLGLSPLHVAALFLAESVTFALIGGLTGYLTGLFMSMFVRAQLGILINFSSSWVVTVVGIVMLAVVLASVYPSVLSSRLVTPSLIRAWKPTKPRGDTWLTPFPFIANDEREANGILAYLYEFFSVHDSFEAEVFWTKRIDLAEKKEAGMTEKALSMDTSLAPYETGVNQSTSFICIKPPDESRYSFQVIVQRTGGSRDYWEKRNMTFLDMMRKQLLLWRSLETEERNRYINKYSELLSK